MITNIPAEIWAFDCEWVPDPLAGRLLYKLPDQMSDDEVLKVMWQEGGATDEDPTPFLKTALCRVVSIATLIRRETKDKSVQLFLINLPEDPHDKTQDDESYILHRFLDEGVGRLSPQLIGYNSRNADLRILTQRAILKGLSLPTFAKRLDAKPWESADVDLMNIISGYGKGYTVSLNEAAVLSGIPGKLETCGNDVCALYYRGELQEIVRYNCFDAITTYLLWLRMARFAGLFDAEQYTLEQQRVRNMLESMTARPETAWVNTYLEAWRRLKEQTGQADDGVFN
jgi:predicted PolB exonuclease-like 3'-5' exonuclease